MVLDMKPLDVIYWIRALLGAVIGLLCTLYLYVAVNRELTSILTLLTGISFAILFYTATFYVVKLKFLGKVEKRSKLLMQGIGVYFFAWIVTWVLAVSLMMPSVSVSVYVGGNLNSGQEFWVAARNVGGQVVQNTTITGSRRMALLPPDTYTFQLGGNLTGYAVGGQNQTLTVGWLESAEVVFNVTQVP
jgi:hypothetical protein